MAKSRSVSVPSTPQASPPPPANHTVFEYRAKVIRVVDGDTVEVDIIKDVGFGLVLTIRKIVRLLGINAPESVGPTAQDEITKLQSPPVTHSL